jgi:hypothetical protein
VARLARQPDATVHLWGHSWEIERLGLWNELERIFAMLAANRPTALSVAELMAGRHSEP